MGERYGKCFNFGNCTRADKKLIVPISDGEEFRCPECKEDLLPDKPPKNGNNRKYIPIAIGIVSSLLLISGIVKYVFFPSPAPQPKPELLTATATKTTTATAAKTTTKTDTGTGMVTSPGTGKSTGTASVSVIGSGTAGGTGTGSSSVTDTGTGTETGTGSAVTAAVLRKMLENGQFDEAYTVKAAFGSTNDPEMSRLFREMNTPVGLSIRFQYRKEGQMNSAPQNIESSQLQNLTLTHKDDYRLHVDIPTGSHPIYLYIFQLDHSGLLQRVFPEPKYSALNNPVQAGILIFPPKEWFYLDELPSSNPDPLPETLLIIASPWDASDVNELFGRIHQATDPAQRMALTQKFKAQLKLRQNRTVPSLFYGDFSFQHSR
jgi:hypothetical protein